MQRNESIDTPGYRSGFVVLIGRPSAGKSSLINAICGHKVSIVSPVPQTTRNTIRGIFSSEKGQIVFLDTPGFHGSDRKINLRMRDVVTEHLSEADHLLYVVDPTRPPGEEERLIAEIVAAQQQPTTIAITKSDIPGRDVATTRTFLEERGLSEFPHVEVGGLAGPAGTADTATGISTLIDTIMERLPSGDPWYPEEYYTDQPPQFRIAEIIREQAIAHAREELPHALFVEVADIEQDESRIWARTFIYVERSSQQGILVGKKGRTITEIRKESERILGSLFPVPVRLSVQVKVRPKWRRDESTLHRLIY